MYCGVCQYSWCWTCGFASYNWFHKIQGSGLFCDCVNGLAFGFDMKIHWFFRLILSILCVGLMPVIGIGAGVFIIIEEFGGDKCFSAFNFCYTDYNCFFKLLFSPFLLSYWIFILALQLTISTIIVAILIIPAYILLFIIFIIIPIRFLCCPKRKQSKKQKELLEKKMEEKRLAAVKMRNNKLSKFR